MLDAEIKIRLLRLARKTIRDRLQGKRREPIQEETWPKMERQGAFVTLRKAGQLRGCIGTFTATASLPETIQEMALAAMDDPRFLSMPIGLAELDDIHIDLSILSPLERIADPLTLVPGVHGIYVKKGYQAGCFLPEVASERGWDAETFLSQCCAGKAGLPPKAWNDKDAEVFVFTVEKIGEEG